MTTGMRVGLAAVRGSRRNGYATMPQVGAFEGLPPVTVQPLAPGAARCRRCVIDSTVAGVKFDAEGVCNHCHIHDRLNELFPVGERGEEFLQEVAAKIRWQGRRRKYDCVVGLSGGRDTCYCLYKTKQLGLRPLAVHFDNGWDSDIAKRNIIKICSKLDVDLHTIIADWAESRELTNCTIRGCLPYIDLTDDIGIVSALYRTAADYGVRWIIHSHSYRCEGINPLRWNYVDARLVRSLIRQFGKQPLVRFRNTDLHHVAYWILVKRIRVFTITNYYDDSDEAVDKLLREEIGWEDTGGWHFDNEIFGLQCYYSRRKFGFDWRTIELAAQVRQGLLTREAALAELAVVPDIERPEVVEFALKSQGISVREFEEILAAPNKYFYDYPTYYPLIRLLRWPIKLACRLNVMPPHTYEKYFDV